MKKYNDNFNLKVNDIVTLEAISEFGESFIKENGSEYKVIKLEFWGLNRLLLRTLKEECETGLVWIGMWPNSSRNLKIINVKK